MGAVCAPVCECGGRGLCVHVCLCVSERGACGPLREKAGAAPSWVPSCNNWFHSFLPLLTSISSGSTEVHAWPCTGGWGQLRAGHTPAPALEELPVPRGDRPGKAESHPQWKVDLVEKTLGLAGTLSLGVVLLAM